MYNIPLSAVVTPDTRDEAIELIEFLMDNGFKEDGKEIQDAALYVDNTYLFHGFFKPEEKAIDIDTANREFSFATRTYYEEDFRREYPELEPEDRFFMCSVGYFLGETNNSTIFEPALPEEVVRFIHE